MTNEHSLQFRLHITLDNDAFGNDNRMEIVRILAEATQAVYFQDGTLGHGFKKTLRDVNGNRVGNMEVVSG